MGNIVLPVREKDSIVTFNIKPYTEEIVAEYNQYSDPSDGYISASNGYLYSYEELSRETAKKFISSVTSYDNGTPDIDFYFTISKKGKVLQFNYPQFHSMNSENLVKIFDKFLIRMLLDKKYVIELGLFNNNQQMANDYIELLNELQNIDESKKIKIIDNTKVHRDCLDKAIFLKQLIVESASSHSLKEYDAHRKFAGHYIGSSFKELDSYIEIAESNYEHLKTLNQVLELTYPEEKGKFLLKTYSSRKRMN